MLERKVCACVRPYLFGGGRALVMVLTANAIFRFVFATKGCMS